MKQYCIGFLSMILVLALLGFVLPSLISSSDTLNVVGGVAIVIGSIFAIAAYFIGQESRRKK